MTENTDETTDGDESSGKRKYGIAGGADVVEGTKRALGDDRDQEGEGDD